MDISDLIDAVRDCVKASLSVCAHEEGVGVVCLMILRNADQDPCSRRSIDATGWKEGQGGRGGEGQKDQRQATTTQSKRPRDHGFTASHEETSGWPTRSRSR